MCVITASIYAHVFSVQDIRIHAYIHMYICALPTNHRTLYWVSGGPGKLVIFNCTLPTCTPQQVEELSPEANTTSLSLNVKKGALLWSEMSAHQSKVWYLNILHSNRAPKVNLKTFNRTETEVQSLAALDEHVYLLERVRGTQGYVQVVGQNGVTTNSRDLFSSEFMDIDILGPAAQPGGWGEECM